VKTAIRFQWAPLLATAVIASIVLSFETKQFGTNYNVYVILQTAAVYAVIGLAQMPVLAVGDMSLAVGGIGSLVTVIVGDLYAIHRWPLGAVLVCGLGLGLICGIGNGVIVAQSRLSGFILTLATGSAFTGIAYGITSSVPYSDIPSSVITLGTARAGFFPYLVIVAIVSAGLVGGILKWLPAGRALLATGGNAEAARLSGLSRQRSLLIAHGLSGLLAAVAAVMYIGVLQSATPDTGSDWLITSFAVPIIGGTALVGGEASASGCLVAALVLATIGDALIVLNVNTHGVVMAEGLLIFVAVTAAKLGQRAQSRGSSDRARISERVRLGIRAAGTGADTFGGGG
jgi:ribose transport system permease protein